MFAYIKGTLEEIHPQKVVLEVGGIGYEIMVPESIIPKLPEIGSQLKLYTYFNVREDIQELYGFNNREEKSIFEKLITVSGIGPKVSMAILSVLTPTQLALAIVTDDIKTLCTAPGVGKKTAQRIVLELREKINKEALIGQENLDSVDATLDSQNEVIEALMALGYQHQEARQAFNAIENKDQDVSTLIRLSLKLLDRR
ncbi:MAG: Holliday junction branch migration protein RuvA [Caldicoprobacterales bacterium]|jgi:Holliday junction DNA helicase RuvA|nr:Holliday junction branch migration protein RuvA [Clostridiales bacterium]